MVTGPIPDIAMPVVRRLAEVSLPPLPEWKCFYSPVYGWKVIRVTVNGVRFCPLGFHPEACRATPWMAAHFADEETWDDVEVKAFTDWWDKQDFIEDTLDELQRTIDRLC